MSDVVEATISEVKAICRSLVADKAAKRTPVNLMGPPGAGKTQTFEQLAQEIKADYRVFLTATMDPTDLVGIPNNANDLYTEFLPPKDFLALTEACGKLDVDPDVPVVAVFEDLPACHPQVFNTLLRFMQQREVGGRKIRDNVFLAATGNRVEDRAGAALIPTALANRFLHFSLSTSAEEWSQWAMMNGVDPLLISFVDRKGISALHNFDPTTGFLAFATPRSVVMAGHAIQAIGHENTHALEIALSGCCGSGWARGSGTAS